MAADVQADGDLRALVSAMRSTQHLVDASCKVCVDLAATGDRAAARPGRSAAGASPGRGPLRSGTAVEFRDGDGDGEGRGGVGGGGSAISVSRARTTSRTSTAARAAGPRRCWRPSVSSLLASVLERRIRHAIERVDGELYAAAKRVRVAGRASDGGDSREAWIRAAQ